MSSCDWQFPFSHLPMQTTENIFRHSLVYRNTSTAWCATDSGSISAASSRGMSPMGCTHGRSNTTFSLSPPPPPESPMKPICGTGGAARLAHVAVAVDEIGFDDDVVTHFQPLQAFAHFRDSPGEFVPQGRRGFLVPSH